MKRAQVLSIAAVFAMAIASAACSSSSTPAPDPATAPTVSSIAISGGNAQALPTASTISTTTGTTTNVSTATSSIAVTFSTAMTVSTITTSNVTLTCASGTAPTLGTPTTADDTTFTFAVTGTFPQKAICTLGFTASITNSSGTAMVATETEFATGCTTNDDFANAATIVAGTGCWTINNSPTVSVDATANTLTISGTTPADDHLPNISKSFTNGTAETISIDITSGPGSNGGACLIAIGDNAELATTGGIIGVDESNVIQVTVGGGAPTNIVAVTLPLTVRLAYDGSSSITPSVVIGGVTTTGTAITGLSIGSTPGFLIGFGGSPATTPSCVFSNFTSTLSATEPNPTGTTGGQD